MPRQVDHDERRRQIAEAVWRLAVSGGLEQVTLRQVAAEAGVSARLLQYYFGTRDELLLGALEILNADGEREARRRLAGVASDLRAIVRGVLLEMLPLDESRRRRQVVHAAYFVRFLTEPRLAAVAEAAPHAVADLVADLLVRGRESGQVPQHVDAAAEAAFLTAGAEGIQTRVLLGQWTSDHAIALIDRQLDRIFPPAG
ncbi:TetR family transcriptional regulator C-terminal domain-containing protein [Nocardia terpenica]|uniref:TetR/AcrR family transcriptional regulator n=1 Tax=Nocardia terpenica TaxID=455432 RepID=UPI0018957AB4|nr:TetR/AcrR family transcriptional regulator [Nocardia terpenica]MBF6061462.1 TetR family transcriptional regulator C-terminal domain-containing protein [Nocardia terpenica]MBF6105309.1 TetR family transcriptional regulator C-terminal domain-containing protein [Nocardia terpenica]MBF6113221.1 TetR family transcriptional regulator C-terminal domain-containing protein [Nocardia terpenica]MBF6119351.1 TetR family transcriptional regulator C-terminal domain-containing protein [Nocardia terpenica]